MYIYHKQCEIMQKIQWNSSNGQLHWFLIDFLWKWSKMDQNYANALILTQCHMFDFWWHELILRCPMMNTSWLLPISLFQRLTSQFGDPKFCLLCFFALFACIVSQYGAHDTFWQAAGSVHCRTDRSNPNYCLQLARLLFGCRDITVLLGQQLRSIRRSSS